MRLGFCVRAARVRGLGRVDIDGISCAPAVSLPDIHPCARLHADSPQ